MDRPEIFEAVKEMLIDSLGVTEKEVRPKSCLERDLGAESLDLLDIEFRVNSKFNIKIKDEITLSSTVNNLVDLVLEKTAALKKKRKKATRAKK